jgi:hypothetical protein
LSIAILWASDNILWICRLLLFTTGKLFIVPLHQAHSKVTKLRT